MMNEPFSNLFVHAWTRRQFLRRSGGFVLAWKTRGAVCPQAPTSHRLLDTESLEKFVDPLPIPAVIRASGKRPHPEHPGISIPFYRVAMREIRVKVHRDLPPTRCWGFGESSPGPTFETRSGEPVLVEWGNELPRAHFLPVDHTIHGAEAGKPEVRTVTHLHGAKAPATSDGYPEDWFVPGQGATYFYPNQQEAAHLWYHDHAIGITRLNMYAGLFGNYFVRDAVEDALNLPKGRHEIPLTLADRSFDAGGQLSYTVSPDPASPWVPEIFADAATVNGKLFPYLEVEPRKYRFRVLNAANARFFRLALSNGREFHQIGTDLGLLPAPVALKSLVLAPAERADLVIDFSESAGEHIVLNNGLLSVMQFRVSRDPVRDSSTLPAALRPVAKIAESEAVQSRILTLGEKDDKSGNPAMMLLNNAHWNMPVTESPKLNSVEIWSLLNFTDDSHPVHLHLVRFQILDRRPFEPEYYYKGGEIRYTGAAVPPAANEAGWKDTVQAHPGMVTRIIARFEGYPGRYVWHCHILEHEDNEMMRPYEVVP
ncbi:MAG TPA: multicopper oxidase [Candidatus Acidoferrum sp.]|nr:multicopper oxidase [Candidatus Acidoferrum sp.]